MRSLFPLLAGLVFGISALPATAAPKPEDRTSGPALVGQARSWSDMLAMIREGAKTIGGDKLADAFDKEVLSSISPAILPAIDPDKPFGLYALAGAEPQLCRLVFLAPVRNSGDFLKQLADFGIKTEKTEGDATFQIESPLPIPVHLKFNEGYACISLGGADALTGKKLLAPKDVINPKEKSPAVLTLHMERIPDGLKKFVTANAADAAEQYRELFPVGDYRETFQLVTSMGLRWLRQLTEQAREISLRLDADPKTTDLKLELAITPIPKTALADAIAARPANTNAFAGLVTKDSVQWMLLSAPMFHEDLREALVKLAAIGRQAAVEQVTQFGTPETLALTESAFKSLGATLKSGSMDLAMVVRGPNAKGHYTAVGAVQLLETADLEKACREALKTAPEPVRKAVKLDAGKLGELNLHEITISDAPEELKKFFGADPTVRIGVSKNVVFVAFGADSKSILAEAVALKPAPAPGFDNSGNLKATAKVIRRLLPEPFLNEQDRESGVGPGAMLDLMEKNDRRAGMTFGLTGGDKLRLTLNYNVQFGLLGGPSGWLFGSMNLRARNFQAIPPVAAPANAKD